MTARPPSPRAWRWSALERAGRRGPTGKAEGGPSGCLRMIISLFALTLTTLSYITDMHTQNKLKLHAAECVGIEPARRPAAARTTVRHIIMSSGLRTRATSPRSPPAARRRTTTCSRSVPLSPLPARARELLLNRAPASPGGYAADAGTD